MTMSVEPWVWAVFTAAILGILALDLFVFHRRAHEVTVREAFGWTLVWATLGIGFAGLLWAWQGGDAAGEYLAGYLIELSLSMDNVFVFAMLFAYFAVPGRTSTACCSGAWSARSSCAASSSSPARCCSSGSTGRSTPSACSWW